MKDNPFAQPEAVDAIPASGSFSILRIAVLTGIAVVMFLVFLPALSRGRGAAGAARRTMCRNNLKQIGLALHNYHDTYGSFPPAFTTDEQGRPLHSWRTLLLPFMEHAALYAKIDLSKPWDDPVNVAARETEMSCYRCPSSDIAPSYTSYLGVTGEHQCFFGNAARRLSDLKDGTSNTVMVVEVPVDKSVPWMSPDDADPAMIRQLLRHQSLSHKGGFQGQMADGSVRFISADIKPQTLDALLTIDGSETIEDY